MYKALQNLKSLLSIALSVTMSILCQIVEAPSVEFQLSCMRS